jgi:hypothetical protein
MRYQTARVRGVGDQQERFCKGCRDWWAAESFRRNRLSAGGRVNECRSCQQLREATRDIFRVVFREL